MDAKNDQYILEIYEPGSTHDAFMSFESSRPFQAISLGDLINPRAWLVERDPGPLLRVVGVEHMLFGKFGSDPKHKVCIFTAAATDDSASRLDK